MQKLYYIFVFIIFVFGCDYNNTSSGDDFKKSYKKQISSGDIDENEVQYFDDNSRIYSNFKYGISFQEKRGWEIDYGVGQYTIYRAIQPDSAYTFSINVIEVNLDSDDDFLDIHEVVDEIGLDAYKAQFENMIAKKANVQVLNSSTKKIYFRNFPAMKTIINHNVREKDYEIGFTNIMYQLTRNNYTITCSLAVPTFFYDENKESLDNIFNGIQLLNIN